MLILPAFLLLLSCSHISHGFRCISKTHAVKSLSSSLPNFFDILDKKNYNICEEARRKYSSIVFTSSDWKRHRSTVRYFNQILSMPRSYVYRSLSRPVLFITFNAFLIVLYNTLNKLYRWPLPLLSCAALPFTLTSSALGLLLVFRTNTAYSRWKDARIAWATISSKCSSLVRQTINMFPEKDKTLKNDMLRCVVAFVNTLRWRLRDPHSDSKLREILLHILPESEILDVMSYQHRPQRIVSKMSEIMRRANLLPNFVCHLDKGISDMVDASYVCDRIYSTPIPLVYTRHTARVLFIWLLLLPMSLYHVLDINKWATVPISFFNAMLLFGIEELGVQIEEPFSILALDTICDEIQSIVKESQTVYQPPPVAPTDSTGTSIPPTTTGSVSVSVSTPSTATLAQTSTVTPSTVVSATNATPVVSLPVTTTTPIEVVLSTNSTSSIQVAVAVPTTASNATTTSSTPVTTPSSLSLAASLINVTSTVSTTQPAVNESIAVGTSSELVSAIASQAPVAVPAVRYSILSYDSVKLDGIYEEIESLPKLSENTPPLPALTSLNPSSLSSLSSSPAFIDVIDSDLVSTTSTSFLFSNISNTTLTN